MKRITKFCILASILVLTLTVTCIFVFATDTASNSAYEATLTVRVEGQEDVVKEGTLTAMATQLRTLAAAVTDTQTTYILNVNRDATTTGLGRATATEYVSVNINLGGHNVTCTGNLIELAGSASLSLSGKGADGNIGTLRFTGNTGALLVSNASRANADVSAEIKDLNVVHTDLSRGFSTTATNTTLSQPMFYVQTGSFTLSNVNMTYTGEDAKFVKEAEGTGENAIFSDFANFSPAFIYATGSAAKPVNITVNNCVFTDTRECEEEAPVNTCGVTAGAYATITLENSKIDAHTAIYTYKNTASINIFSSELKATKTALSGVGYITVTSSETTVEEGAVLSDSSTNHKFVYSYETPNRVYASTIPTTLGYDELYELRALDTGVYEVMGKEGTEAILTVTASNGTVTETAGTLKSHMTTLTGELAEDTEYRIVLFSDAASNYITVAKSTASTKIILDLNGFTITHGSGSFFSITSETELVIDGADSLGKSGRFICKRVSGALIYSNCKTVTEGVRAEVRNLDITYTNLAQGYADTSKNVNQPMANINYGKVSFDNVKFLYTGADATFTDTSYAATNEEYKNKSHNGELATDISWLSPDFIRVSNNSTLILTNCELIDENTKGIRTSGIKSAGTANVTVENTKIVAFFGINNSSSSVTIKNCDITGNYITYQNTGTLNIYDTSSRTGKVIKGETETAATALVYGKGTTTFCYGAGKNLIYSEAEPTVTVEDGYELTKRAEGVYAVTVKIPDDVDALLKIEAEGEEVSSEMGTLSDFLAGFASLSPTVPTTYTVTLLKDVGTLSAPIAGVQITGNDNVTINLNLNGYDLYLKSYINIADPGTDIHINGENALGECSTVTLTQKSICMLQTYATIVADTVSNVSIRYLNVLAVNYQDTGRNTPQNLIHLRGQTVAVIDGLNVTFTAENAGANTDNLMSLISIRNSAKLSMKNSTLTDTNNKGILVYGIYQASSTAADLDSVTVSVGNAINSTVAAGVINIKNSTIMSTVAPYAVTGTVNVTDTVTKLVGTTTLKTGSGSLNFAKDNGSTFIVADISDMSMLTGSYNTADGYIFYKTGESFELIYASDYYGTIDLPTIFANGMVIQRDKPINIYGTSFGNGNTVTVTISAQGFNETLSTTVEDGKWSVTFDKKDACRGVTLTVTETAPLDEKTLEFTDIDIGDVWFIGGQSNAAYEFYKMEDAEEYILNADNFDNIRIYSQPSSMAAYPNYKGNGTWNIASSEFLKSGDVSAIGYVMATRLAAEFPDVTIAIVDVNYPGTSIQNWISEEELIAKFGESSTEYTEFLAARDFYDANGRMPTSSDGSYNTRPATSVYNAMTAHLEGYTGKGVMWYQGCSNIGTVSKYAQYYDALTKTWRGAFCDDELPFFVVQLAPYGGNVAHFRSVQYLLKDQDSNTYIINANTEGNVMNASDLAYSAVSGGTSSPMVHPSRKSPVGHRLADSILYNVYGLYEDETVLAPEVVKIEYIDGKVIVTFDTDLSIFYGDSVEGFEVSGADGQFYYASAEIVDNTVILTCDKVSVPTEVRYGYGAVITVELEDGTLIKCTAATKDGPHTNNKDEGYVILVDENGVSYTIYAEDDVVIRSFNPGNITNASGHPMHIFKLAVGYTAPQG